jgi:hypothetical protein
MDEEITGQLVQGSGIASRLHHAPGNVYELLCKQVGGGRCISTTNRTK